MRHVLAAVVLCVALTAPAVGTTASFALPFFELEELKLSGDLAVGRFTTLTDQRSLYAVRLADGHVVMRIDDVGGAPFDVHRNRLVFADAGGRQVVDVDLGSRRRAVLWTIPADTRVSAIHVSEGRVMLVVSDVHSGWVGLSHGTEGWNRVGIPEPLQIVALAGDRVVGVDRSAPARLVARLLDGPSGWQTIYPLGAGSLPAGVRPTADGRAVEFLERDASNAVALVRLPLDGAAAAVASVAPEAMKRRSRASGWSDEYVAWTERRDGRLFLSSLARVRRPSTAPILSAVPAVASGSVMRSDRATSADRAVQWLERQLSPAFATPLVDSARLIDSYEDSTRAGWIYDAAVAAITFTAVGRTSRATQLLAGLAHLQQDDGSWISSFDPDTATPRGSDRYVGAIAWVVMSVNYFERHTGDRRFAAMARRGLAYLERFRVTDAASKWRGAFRMGPTRPTAISIEHTVDCFSAFLWRGRLDGNPRDMAVAEAARAFILGQLWRAPGTSSPPDGYFRVGVGTGGVFLDAQTWTALALSERVTDPRLAQAVATAERTLRVDAARLGSVRQIVGFDESDEASRRKVWAEGTEGMVAALLALGETGRAMEYHRETGRYQSVSGGIPYSTDNAEGWTTAPSVAATAWYVLNSLVPARNPFNPG